MFSKCSNERSLKNAVDLAGILSRDAWAMATLDLAHGTPQCCCSRADAGLCQASGMLETRVGATDCDLACDAIQGYSNARPMNAEQARARLAEHPT
jgi:hypothetical protein